MILIHPSRRPNNSRFKPTSLFSFSVKDDAIILVVKTKSLHSHCQKTQFFYFWSISRISPGLTHSMIILDPRQRGYGCSLFIGPAASLFAFSLSPSLAITRVAHKNKIKTWHDCLQLLLTHRLHWVKKCVHIALAIKDVQHIPLLSCYFSFCHLI